MIKIISDHIKAYDKVNPSHELGYGIISHIMFGHESSLIHLEIKKGKLLVMPDRRGHEHSGIEYEHINCMGLDENDFYHFADDEKVAYIENKCNEIETILKAIKCLGRRAIRPQTKDEKAKIDSAREERDQLQLKLENEHKAEPEDGIDGMTYEIPDYICRLIYSMKEEANRPLFYPYF